MWQQIIDKFLPDPSIIRQLLLPVIVLAIAAALIAAQLKRKEMRTPYTRKIFHFFIFSTAGILQYRFGVRAVSLLGAVVFLVVVIAVITGNRWWFYRALARETDAPHQKKFIILPLLATTLGGLLSNIFFPATAYIGYFVGGWGDAIGEPVGTRWGKHRYTVPTLFGVRATRSIEGSVAVMLVSTMIAFICLLPITHVAWFTCAAWALVCGIVAASVESVSSHGLDNLTIQVCAAGVLHYLLQ